MFKTHVTMLGQLNEYNFTTILQLELACTTLFLDTSQQARSIRIVLASLYFAFCHSTIDVGQLLTDDKYFLPDLLSKFQTSVCSGNIDLIILTIICKLSKNST